MSLQKRKPYRNKEFLKFCHETGEGPCCVCDGWPWQQLHHFGGDGGMGMRASDNCVARVCRSCHEKVHSVLGRTLSVKAIMYPSSYSEQLIWFVAMQEDALVLNRAWIEHLEAAK